MAGDGGGDSRAKRGKILIQRGFAVSFAGLLNDFTEHAFQGGAIEAHGSGFNREGLRAEGFHLEAVSFELIRDLGKNDHLPRFEFDEQGHQKALALDVLYPSIAEDLLEKHPFMCNVLIDDPKTPLPDGKDKGSAELADGSQGSKAVERGGELLGFDLGGTIGRWRQRVKNVGRATVVCRGRSFHEGRGGLSQCLLFDLDGDVVLAER